MGWNKVVVFVILFSFLLVNFVVGDASSDCNSAGGIYCKLADDSYQCVHPNDDPVDCIVDSDQTITFSNSHVRKFYFNSFKIEEGYGLRLKSLESYAAGKGKGGKRTSSCGGPDGGDGGNGGKKLHMGQDGKSGTSHSENGYPSNGGGGYPGANVVFDVSGVFEVNGHINLNGEKGGKGKNSPEADDADCSCTTCDDASVLVVQEEEEEGEEFLLLMLMLPKEMVK
jgi:hypothetical protein